MTGIDWAQVWNFIEVVSALLGLVAFFGTLWLRSNFVTKVAHQHSIERIEELFEDKVEKLNGKMESHTTLSHTTQITLTKLGGTVEALKEVMERLEKSVDLLNSFTMHRRTL